MSVWLLATVGLIAALILFAIYWLIQYRLGDSGIVDVFWGASVAAIGVFFCWNTPGDPSRRWLGAGLITLWAIRLSYFLFLRWRSHDEDPRYVALKQQWGDSAQLRMFRFYQMQGLGCFLFALPLLAAGYNESPLSWIDGLAVAVWAISIVGEAFADSQLRRFRKQPENRGRVCRSGLWRYSRHPNYFFEWLHWWTYVFLSISTPYGWLTILAPVAMWFFLNHVTGIPQTEIQAIKSRGNRYRAYQATTNAFFPWFPSPESDQND